MIEKIKAVNNPLTIIAIFAALAEIAGTVALKLVSDNLQITFIWFVMLFPVLLVLLFFITLNFNPKVLYAPSDFRNEENFLTAIGGVDRLSVNLEELERQLETAKSQIIDEAIKQIGIAGEKERSHIAEIVNTRIGRVQEKVDSTRESVKHSLATLESLRWDVSGTIESEAVRKFEIFCKDLATPDVPTAEHIFCSVTYGHGISSIQEGILEMKGLIENRDGKVHLTEKGRKIWEAVRNSKK